MTAPVGFGTGRNEACTDRGADHQCRRRDGDEAARDHVNHVESTGEQQIKTAGVLFTAGDAGGCKQNPDTCEHEHREAGAPDRKPSGIVECHRGAEKDSDGGVLGECLQARGGESALEHGLVLDGDDRRHPAADDGDDQCAAADLTQRESADGPSGRRG